MKKRLLACLLAACMAVSMLVLPASAASLNNSAIQTAITLGAMDTSQTGSLDAAVTRGAFAKMLVSFSAYRESAAQQGNIGTLYKDVPGTSQWAPYVKSLPCIIISFSPGIPTRDCINSSFSAVCIILSACS